MCKILDTFCECSIHVYLQIIKSAILQHLNAKFSKEVTYFDMTKWTLKNNFKDKCFFISPI